MVEENPHLTQPWWWLCWPNIKLIAFPENCITDTNANKTIIKIVLWNWRLSVEFDVSVECWELMGNYWKITLVDHSLFCDLTVPFSQELIHFFFWEILMLNCERTQHGFKRVWHWFKWKEHSNTPTNALLSERKNEIVPWLDYLGIRSFWLLF